MATKKWISERKAVGGCTSCSENQAEENHKQCRICLDKKNDYEKNRRAADPEHRQALRDSQRRHKNRTRNEALKLLGGKCECCKETINEFLTFDHKYKDGNEHRKKLRHFATGVGLYRRLLRDAELRKKFRILCWNCNCSIGIHGHCPHQER
ncbi:MAG: hypothetical protein C5B59_06690 [Bacteroidetes bacterium]|nr:MAG: hypothetical protein C5B59_06690 [Bacteroidota bacterium]